MLLGSKVLFRVVRVVRAATLVFCLSVGMLFSSSAQARPANIIEAAVISTLVQCYGGIAAQQVSIGVLPQILSKTNSALLTTVCGITAYILAQRLQDLYDELNTASGSGVVVVAPNPFKGQLAKLIWRLRGAALHQELMANTFMAIGGGFNGPIGDRSLTFPSADQAIVGHPEMLAYLELGHTTRLFIQGLDISIGLVGQYQNWSHVSVVNIPPTTSSPLGGTSHSFSLFPRIAVEGPLVRDWNWRLSGGAGIAHQSMAATDGGTQVLSGSAWTPMAHVSAGVVVPVNGFNLSAEIFATWLGGYTVRTNTNTPADYGSHVNSGLIFSVRKPIGPASHLSPFYSF